MLNNIFNNIKREYLLVLSFFFLSKLFFCQKNNFSDALIFKKNIEIKELSNNPYKLITECFFNKSINSEILWGNTKISSKYFFDVLNLENNETTKVKVDLEKLKTQINKKDYNSLMYYGFSTLIRTKTYSLFDVGNTLHLFNEKNNELIFQKTIYIPDSIAFNYLYAISDSCIILLDYRASFDANNKIKAYHFNLNSTKITKVFEDAMGSNSACYDKANTKFYDSNKKYSLITDNLDYKINLFDNNANKIFTYSKPLLITDNSRKILNPNGIKKNTLDSIALELENTPRIINTQFVNDSDIIVNYALKSNITQNGIKIKNSTIDLLTVRNGAIVYKQTFDDSFYYELVNFGTTNKVSQSMMNPYLRSELFHFTQNNFLIKITFKQLIPKSKTSFEKYIRKAKFSILNLKSNLIYSVYEFHH